MTEVIRGLRVYKDKMLQNLESSRGMVFSQGLLLRLIEKGLTREEAYKMVQDCAKQVWDENRNFKEVVLKDRAIAKHLNKKEISTVFDYAYHTKHMGEIFERLGI